MKFQEINEKYEYKNFTHKPPADFEFVINSISPKITNKDTTYRAVIPVEERLVITLRFLLWTIRTTCNTVTKFQTSISQIILENFQAVLEALK
jgi:hypothetical protein